VTTGGTGVTPDDVTIEAVSQQYDKSLPGFGELFRRRSEAEIGTRVLGTRATAGIIDTVPVFCLPGSENAATLGSNELIVPEASHLAGLAARDET
jgi:Molybdopterin biosynthesis enzymes